MAKAATAPESEWITKQQAAQMLSVNVRQVEKRQSAGYIQKRVLPRRPTESAGRVEYAKADVDALLAGTPNQYGEAVTETAAPTSSTVVVHQPRATPKEIAAAFSGAQQADYFAVLSTHLAKLSAAYPPPRREWPAWLALADAVEYSGLPSAELERLLREGLIYSFGRGPKTWRIQKAALDAYGTAAHQ